MTTISSTREISSLVAETNSATKIMEESDAAKEVARKRALAAAKKWVLALQTPKEMIYQHAFNGPDRLCVRLAVTLRIFHHLAAREGRSVDAAELASLCGAEHLFIVRIMRVITAADFAKEAGEESYIATKITKAMTVPATEAAIIHVYDHDYQIFPKMPAYFETHGYECPSDPNDTPFQYAFGTKLGYFDYLEQDAKSVKTFDTFMTANRGDRPIFAHWFPVQEQIINGFRHGKNGSDVLMVDIGGGLGQDLERLRALYPQAGGRLINQDLARTVADTSFTEGIEAMPYDFFTPQPVKGARVYFFHHVLHNWPEGKVKEILANQASAMTPGYSKLILNEIILPAKDGPIGPGRADVAMMADFAAGERSEKQFRELLGSVGFSNITFWYPPGSFDGAVVAMLGDQPYEASRPVVNGINGHA